MNPDADHVSMHASFVALAGKLGSSLQMCCVLLHTAAHCKTASYKFQHKPYGESNNGCFVLCRYCNGYDVNDLSMQIEHLLDGATAQKVQQMLWRAYRTAAQQLLQVLALPYICKVPDFVSLCMVFKSPHTQCCHSCATAGIGPRNISAVGPLAKIAHGQNQCLSSCKLG